MTRESNGYKTYQKILNSPFLWKDHEFWIYKEIWFSRYSWTDPHDWSIHEKLTVIHCNAPLFTLPVLEYTWTYPVCVVVCMYQHHFLISEISWDWCKHYWADHFRHDRTSSSSWGSMLPIELLGGRYSGVVRWYGMRLLLLCLTFDKGFTRVKWMLYVCEDRVSEYLRERSGEWKSGMHWWKHVEALLSWHPLEGVPRKKHQSRLD